MTINLKQQVINAILNSDAANYLEKSSRRDIEEYCANPELLFSFLRFEIQSPDMNHMLDVTLFIRDTTKKRRTDDGMYLDTTTTVQMGWGGISPVSVDSAAAFTKLLTIIQQAIANVPRSETTSQLIRSAEDMKEHDELEAAEKVRREINKKIYNVLMSRPDSLKNMRIGSIRKINVVGSEVPDGAYPGIQMPNKMMSVEIDGSQWTVTRYN